MGGSGDPAGNWGQRGRDDQHTLLLFIMDLKHPLCYGESFCLQKFCIYSIVNIIGSRSLVGGLYAVSGDIFEN